MKNNVLIAVKCLDVLALIYYHKSEKIISSHSYHSLKGSKQILFNFFTFCLLCACLHHNCETFYSSQAPGNKSNPDTDWYGFPSNTHNKCNSDWENIFEQRKKHTDIRCNTFSKLQHHKNFRYRTFLYYLLIPPVDSALHPSEIDHMSTTNSWELSGKK